MRSAATLESPCVEPVFPKKHYAIDYAQNRGLLPIWRNSLFGFDRQYERIISFDDGNRKL
jgi:hypothetical protein